MNWIKRFFCWIFHHKKNDVSPEYVKMQSNNMKEEPVDRKPLLGTNLVTAAKEMILYIMDDSVWNTETFLNVNIHEIVEKMQTLFHEFSQSDIVMSDVIPVETFKSLETRVFNMEAIFLNLKKECSNLLLEGEELRKVIANYTKVVQEINAKRLKDKEFAQVKEKLEPQLQSIRKQRSDYLAREEKLDQAIQSFQQELNNAVIETKKISKTVIENYKQEPFF